MRSYERWLKPIVERRPFRCDRCRLRLWQLPPAPPEESAPDVDFESRVGAHEEPNLAQVDVTLSDHSEEIARPPVVQVPVDWQLTALIKAVHARTVELTRRAEPPR